MERSHIDAGLKEQHLFIGLYAARPDVLGGGGKDIREKTLVFFIIMGKQPAYRIYLFVLVFQHGAEIGIKTAFFRGIVHIGYGFLTWILIRR
jgi:hypothetical protein